jgi:hypothetical protein
MPGEILNLARLQLKVRLAKRVQQSPIHCFVVNLYRRRNQPLTN